MMTTGTLAYAISVDSAFRGTPALRAIAAPLTKPPWRKRRFFRRAEPTTFQRCLAVHLYFASTVGTLD
jgi:hypothetical protein